MFWIQQCFFQVHTLDCYSVLSSAWLLLLSVLLAFNTRIFTVIMTFICTFWLLSILTLFPCWFVKLHYWLSCKGQQCYMVVSHWPQLYMIMSLIIHTCFTQFCWFYQCFLPHMLQMLDLNTELSLTWIRSIQT